MWSSAAMPSASPRFSKIGDALTALQVTFNGKPWYIIADNSTAVDVGSFVFCVFIYHSITIWVKALFINWLLSDRWCDRCDRFPQMKAWAIMFSAGVLRFPSWKPMVSDKDTPKYWLIDNVYIIPHLAKQNLSHLSLHLSLCNVQIIIRLSLLVIEW